MGEATELELISASLAETLQWVKLLFCDSVWKLLLYCNTVRGYYLAHPLGYLETYNSLLDIAVL